MRLACAIVFHVSLATACAFANGLHLDCTSKYHLRYSGNTIGLVEVAREAGRSNDALRLKCPTNLVSALFHGSDQVAVEDVTAPIRVTAWIKGASRGSVGFLCYDAQHRNVYIEKSFRKYEIAVTEGWRHIMFEYHPQAGSDYCNKVGYVVPYVTCASGEEILVDDVEIAFSRGACEAKVSGGSVGSVDEFLVPKGTTPCIPVVDAIPRMTGVFNATDWKDSVRLGRFVVLKTENDPARENTVVFLCRDRKTLFVALVMDGENVPEALERREKDLVKAPWALPGIECVMGREGSVLHLAFDRSGRYYSNRNIRLYVSTDYAKTRIVVRFALPLDQLPREKASDLVTRMNFYRKSRSGVSSWCQNKGEQFCDARCTSAVNLATIEEVEADIRAQAEARAKSLARGAELREKYGMVKHAVPMADWSYVEPRWRPKKVFGRDYWNSVITMGGTFDRFRAAGIADDPFIKEAVIWMWWERNTEQLLDPNGWAQKVLREHPASAVAVKTMDRLFLDEANRKRPDILAYWDGDYAEKFLSVYDDSEGRFLGFWEDEAFVAGSGYFAAYLDKFGMPMPKDRNEAYKAFSTFYNMRFDKVPEITPFRNVANASPHFHRYACNSAAATFNHFTSALGDMMSGNETGDCMGCNPPKFAIARGAARQWGRPWRNYQTYYQWAYVESKKAGGLRCQYDNVNLLKPGCRYYMYDFCNGPDVGMDEARHKNTFLYPYFCGCGVYSSEANHTEMLQWYDDEEIKTADPMCVALRDPECKWISPLARTNRHFYDEIVKKRDRGVMLTPIGVIFDRANGYATLYFGNSVWDFFAPSEMEQTMWSFNNHVFKKYESNPHYATSEFGDVFDIITNDATEEFLRSYPVLMPIGDVTLDAPFATKLRAYVESGGTLVINAALALKYSDAFDAAFLGAKIGGEPRKAVGCYSRLTGGQILEEAAFRYHPLTVCAGVETLAVTADDVEAPVITLNRVGNGRVILTAPDNMKPAGSCDRMLKLFDDLVMTLRYDALPIRVKADANVQYALARNETSFLVYLNNNNGIPVSSGVHKDPPRTDIAKRAGAKIAIPARLGNVVRAFDWWTSAEVPVSVMEANGEMWATVSTVLPGGDCAVIEFELEKKH